MTKRKRAPSKKSQEGAVDVLVEWDNGVEKNVVSTTELIYQEPIREGAKVTMLWEGVPWEGKVIAVEASEMDFPQDVIEDSDSDSDMDVPLATFTKRPKKDSDSDMEDSDSDMDMPLATFTKRPKNC
eukprot:XP_001175798.1 PREDICTED: uncharacterized protein LOC752295 isoform X1 [Strongylocentrotus purpuratus]